MPDITLKKPTQRQLPSRETDITFAGPIPRVTSSFPWYNYLLKNIKQLPFVKYRNGTLRFLSNTRNANYNYPQA